MMANICTHWTTMTALTLSASHQTVTGCALHTVHQSKSGIWHARKPSKNFVQKSFRKHKRPTHHNVCRSPGRPMAKPCSLDTVTTPSVYGKCQSQHLVKMCPSSKEAIRLLHFLTYFVIKVHIKYHDQMSMSMVSFQTHFHIQYLVSIIVFIIFETRIKNME